MESGGVSFRSSLGSGSAATNAPRACDGIVEEEAGISSVSKTIYRAIADRTAVLELRETTYNRRYIALVRRARALWRLGDSDAAYEDIDAILAAADIAMEQKMAARLQRAEWLISGAAPASAVPDLETVAASVRNFDGIDERARALLAELCN